VWHKDRQNGKAVLEEHCSSNRITMDYSIENVTQIVQKVRQANWRVQRQWIGLFLLGLVAVSMVAGIYLNITVRATLAGREIQAIQAQLIDDRQKNSDLETQMAGLTSVSSMQQRAEGMGFSPAEMGDITYVLVPGYKAQSSVDMSQPANTLQTHKNSPVLLPSYTESLFDWITRKLVASGSSGVQP
jgi:cell division protein FtsL